MSCTLWVGRFIVGRISARPRSVRALREGSSAVRQCASLSSRASRGTAVQGEPASIAVGAAEPEDHLHGSAHAAVVAAAVAAAITAAAIDGAAVVAPAVVAAAHVLAAAAMPAAPVDRLGVRQRRQCDRACGEGQRYGAGKQNARILGVGSNS